MSEISEQQLAAFGQELEKLSAWYHPGNLVNGVTNTLKEAPDMARRFAQRQRHSITGHMPEGGYAAMRMGSAVAGNPAARKAAKEYEEMGLTSLPGLAKGLVGKDRKEVVRRALNHQWNGTSNFDKALTVGFPAAGLAGDALSPDDGHKGERIGAGIASTAAGVLTPGVPLAGGIISGIGASMAGGALGKGVDKLRGKLPVGRVQPPPNPEDAKGLAVPAEHILSPSAQNRSEVFG